MKINLLKPAAVIIAILACFSCAKEQKPEAAVENILSPLAPEKESSTVPGQIIVQFTPSMTTNIEEHLCADHFETTKAGALNDILGQMKVTKIERLYPDAGEWEPRHREAGLHTWYVITYDPDYTPTKASVQLESIEGIQYVEPVRKAKPTAIFNDPYLNKQWHYINNGGSGYSAGCDINVLPVWQNFTGGSSDVIVSVVDGGIDMSHPDLKAVCIPGGKEGSKNFVDNTFNIIAHDHGTHVAGTVGAINNNNIGVCGVAGGTNGKGGVRLMSCQVFKPNPNDPGKDLSADDFGNAMVWGADHGAVISQNSWGYVYSTQGEAANGSVGGMKSAIDYFIKYAGLDKNGNQVGPMKGGIVIFAAGNDAWPDGWPAEYSATEPLCISVGATTGMFTRASFSNYGDWVTLCAPGVEICSTMPNNDYNKMEGTSMACPHVSGVAALLVSYFGGPGFTNEMLREKLVKGANKNIAKTAKIGQMVDAFGAFTCGDSTAPDAVSDYSISSTSNNIDFTWNVTKDSGSGSIGKAYSYLLVASTKKSQITKSVKDLPADIAKATVETGDKNVGESISGRVSGLDFDASYYTAVYAVDNAGNYSECSTIKSIKTGINNPPVVETEYAGDYRVKAHETLRVKYHIYDPDGHSFKVTFNGGSAAATDDFQSIDNHTMTIVGKNAEAGKYTACYTVTDSYGKSTEYKIDYEILINHAPVVKTHVADIVFEELLQKKALNMDEYIQDEDGETLSFSSEMSPKGVVSINQVQNVLNITALDFGLTKITVTGADACGLKVALPFQVLVRDPQKDPDVYPNPLGSDNILKIHDGAKKQISAKLTSAMGSTLVELSGEYDAFNPMTIDMSAYAPGRYGVEVKTADKTVKKTIVKL